MLVCGLKHSPYPGAHPEGVQFYTFRLEPIAGAATGEQVRNWAGVHF